MPASVPTKAEFDAVKATITALTARVQALEAHQHAAPRGVFGRAVFGRAIYSRRST
jgi:hypothetical protein